MVKRVAAIYDIHGNASALDAVLSEIENCHVDAIVVGGDLAWGPQPALVMERILSLSGNVYSIRGNADREVAGRYGAEQGLDDWIAEINQWCSDQLTEPQKEFLQNLPESVTLNIDGLGQVLFVHGSPRSDEEAIRKDTPDSEIAPMIDSVSQDIIVCGHTHIQFDRTVLGKRIINAGSVGLQSAARGACWLLLGPDIDLRETQYDYRHAADQIRLWCTHG
ncbi:metallophosphoesterase family protein [Alicyclobacillus pomorum]|uniref:metallophosphoesterase family protein n=1 Tax=Alicyclobacillus pomorum TaxID=204470 RepID=UPI0003FAFBD9|nr:metallophosphoesterase family protein [Alicyclobacillus pomorum]